MPPIFKGRSLTSFGNWERWSHWANIRPAIARFITLAAKLQGSGRSCPEGYEWVEYFDPKWHYEDWRMRQLEEARRANDLKIADIDQRSQDAMLKMMEEQTKIAAEHAKTAEASQGHL